MFSDSNFSDFAQSFINYFAQNGMLIAMVVGISSIVAVVRCYFWREAHEQFVHRGDFRHRPISVEMLRKLPELFREKFYSTTMTDDARFEFVNEHYSTLCRVDASILQRGFTEDSLEEYNLAHIGKRQFWQCIRKWILAVGVGLSILYYITT